MTLLKESCIIDCNIPARHNCTSAARRVQFAKMHFWQRTERAGKMSSIKTKEQGIGESERNHGIAEADLPVGSVSVGIGSMVRGYQ